MIEVKPGDIILYPDSGAWKHHIFALLQEKFGELGNIKEPIYTHVAMIANDPDLVVEMKWPRPRFRFFADDVREKVIMRPKVDQKVITRAIYWCYMNIDTNYSFLNMILGKMGVTKSYKVCSGWIDTAFKEAGSPLTSTDDVLISPNELASSHLLERVA